MDKAVDRKLEMYVNRGTTFEPQAAERAGEHVLIFLLQPPDVLSDRRWRECGGLCVGGPTLWQLL